MASTSRTGDLPGGGGFARKPRNLYIDDMEALTARVEVVEAETREIKSILGRLEPAIGRLAEKLDRLSLDVAEVKGRLAHTPTTAQLIGLVIGIFGLAFGLIKLTT